MPRRTVRDGIYTRKDRDGYWISWTDAQGRRRYRKTSAQNLTQARQALAAERVRVEQAKVLGFSTPGEDSFEDVAKRFLAYQKHRVVKRSYDRQEEILRLHLRPFFTGKLADIRRADIQRYVTKRLAKASPDSVVKELNTLKHLLKLAVEWELIPYSVATGVKAPKVAPGRVRYLQPTELKALLEGAIDWLRPIIALAVLTGMRRGEILSMRWLDVDLAGGRVMLPQTKNGEGRIVYLNSAARDVIRSLHCGADTKPTDKLFPIRADWVSLAFRRLTAKLEIEDFRFHDLRHTAASWLRMSGADIHTVAQILGHKDLRMAARYQHLSPAFLAEAVNLLDGVFGNLCYQDVTGQKSLPEAVLVSD